MDNFYCSFCGKACINKNSLRNHERLCKSNKDRQLTRYEKYGPIVGFNNKGRVPWNKGLTKETDSRVAKYGKTFHEKCSAGELAGSYRGRLRTQEEKENISKSMLRVCASRDSSLCGKGKRGYYSEIYCQSSWELAFVIYCKDKGIAVSRNKERFSYEFEGKMRSYFPDFYLPEYSLYIEVKGYYDDKTKAKLTNFPKKIKVLTKVEMSPILTYVEEVYGKDFTRLYS